MFSLLFLCFLPAVPADDVGLDDDLVSWDDYVPCALTTTYLVCKIREIPVDWNQLRTLLGPMDENGTHSFNDICRAAKQLGLTPIPLEVDKLTLHDLPMPVIAQIRVSTAPSSKTHFLLILRRESDGVMVLDPPLQARFLPDNHFKHFWTGRVLVFARDEVEANHIRNKAQTWHPSRLLFWLWISGGIALLSGALGSRLFTRTRTLHASAATPFFHNLVNVLFTRRAVLGASALVVAAVSGFLALNYVGFGTQAQAICVFSEPETDLGELTLGEHTINVLIDNPGKAPLLIDKVESNCSCAVTDFPTEIGPGSSAAMQVKIGVSPGPRVVRLLVSTNDPEGPKNVVLSWRGKIVPLLIPRFIDSASVRSDRPFERMLHVVYPGGKKAIQPHLKSFACDSDRVHLREGANNAEATKAVVSRILTKVIGQLDLHVTVQPPAQAGLFRATCKFTLAHGDMSTDYEVPICIPFVSSPLQTDVPGIVFSGDSLNEIKGYERTFRVTDYQPDQGALAIRELPNWLSCEEQPAEGDTHVFRLRVVSLPSKRRIIHTLRIARQGDSHNGTTFPVHVFVPD